MQSSNPGNENSILIMKVVAIPIFFYTFLFDAEIPETHRFLGNEKKKKIGVQNESNSKIGSSFGKFIYNWNRLEWGDLLSEVNLYTLTRTYDISVTINKNIMKRGENTMLNYQKL